MTFYNAIIFDKERRIVGRTHITNISRFSSPSSNWVAYHEGATLTDSKLPPKLIGPHNLIALMQRSGGRHISLEIRTLTGKTLNFFVTADATVKDVKAIIEGKEGIPIDQQRLIFGKKELEDGYRLVDYNITSDCTMDLVLRLRGGGCGMNMKNLEGETVTGSGKLMDPNDTDKWKGYSFGLNIIGKCDNGDCKSNKIECQPILKRGLSYCRLTRGDPLNCPACECETFRPANFIVAGARSAINFRKIGDIQIKSTLLESPGDYPKYATYAESNDTVEYDEIEVETTRLNGSPFFCNFCATFIMRRDSEAGQPCGHYFHKECADKFKDCPICNAELLIGEAVEKLFGLSL